MGTKLHHLPVGDPIKLKLDFLESSCKVSTLTFSQCEKCLVKQKGVREVGDTMAYLRHRRLAPTGVVRGWHPCVVYQGLEGNQYLICLDPGKDLVVQLTLCR